MIFFNFMMCTLHKKRSLPLSISSVYLTKSAENCGFGHITEEILNGNLLFSRIANPWGDGLTSKISEPIHFQEYYWQNLFRYLIVTRFYFFFSLPIDRKVLSKLIASIIRQIFLQCLIVVWKYYAKVICCFIVHSPVQSCVSCQIFVSYCSSSKDRQP